MLIARGDWSTFVTRPVSLGLLLICVLALVAVASPLLRRKRKEAFQESSGRDADLAARRVREHTMRLHDHIAKTWTRVETLGSLRELAS
jgi:hypothetical protein